MHFQTRVYTKSSIVDAFNEHIKHDTSFRLGSDLIYFNFYVSFILKQNAIATSFTVQLVSIEKNALLNGLKFVKWQSSF